MDLNHTAACTQTDSPCANTGPGVKSDIYDSLMLLLFCDKQVVNCLATDRCRRTVNRPKLGGTIHVHQQTQLFRFTLFTLHPS